MCSIQYPPSQSRTCCAGVALEDTSGSLEETQTRHVVGALTDAVTDEHVALLLFTHLADRLLPDVRVLHQIEHLRLKVLAVQYNALALHRDSAAAAAARAILVVRQSKQDHTGLISIQLQCYHSRQQQIILVPYI